MQRKIPLLLLALLVACGGSHQHGSEDGASHHGERHAAEQKHKHGGGAAHKHRHGHGHDKHAHGGDKYKHGTGHGKYEHGVGGPLGHRFEDADEWAKRFDDPERDAWQKPAHVVEVMKIDAGMRVADIGAGTGYFLPYLSRAVGENGSVEGLDIESDMVRYMTERAAREALANVSARVVATDDPGLAAGSTDRILIVDTWHHIRDRVAYSKKLAAALSDRGAIYIVDFTMESEHGPPVSHRLEASSIVAELEAAGLSARVLEETLPNQYVVEAARK